MARRGLAEKVTFEQRSEGDEGVSHAGFRRKSVQEKGQPRTGRWRAGSVTGVTFFLDGLRSAPGPDYLSNVPLREMQVSARETPGQGHVQSFER